MYASVNLVTFYNYSNGKNVNSVNSQTAKTHLPNTAKTRAASSNETIYI